MTGLDTNVLVRYITQDNPLQSKAASKLIESHTVKNPLYINIIVLCETVWVLKCAYKHDKKSLADIIEQILTTDILIVEEEETVWTALNKYRKGKADFSDYLIGSLNASKKVAVTYTFDTKLSSPDFNILSS